MRWSAAIVLGLAGYLFFLLYTLPAPQVVGWIAGTGQMPVTLHGVSGTVWSGEAESVSYQQRPLGQLQWRFKPTGLFQGMLAYAFELNQAGQQLQGTFLTGWGDDYRLEDVDALLLASQLPEWLQQRHIRIDGKVRAQQLDLAFAKGQLTGAEGSLQWLEGALRSPLNLMIGDLQADLTTDEESGDIKAAVRDLQGTVAIQAEARLKPDGNFRFEGKLKPGDKADPGLAGALQAVGRRQPDGTILLNYAGRM